MKYVHIIVVIMLYWCTILNISSPWFRVPTLHQHVTAIFTL